MIAIQALKKRTNDLNLQLSRVAELEKENTEMKNELVAFSQRIKKIEAFMK